MRRWTLVVRWSVVLVAAAVAATVWIRRGEESAAGYFSETLDRGDIVAAVTATGTVNPVATVQVGTYVSGPILAIDVDFNSSVTKGQRVAKIDPAPFQVKVRRAEANLANARARVDKSRADLALKALNLRRQRELFQKRLVAESDVDVAASDHAQAEAQVALDAASAQQSEAELEEAQINLSYTDITSPVDGVVVSRNVDVGQTVAASFQTPTLFLIAQDLTQMQVNASVSESDIGAVREGQPTTFTVDAYPGRGFGGKVVQVRNAPVTLQNVVTYDVVIAVDNAALELKPGMTATVSITSARRDDVLRIPIRALSFTPERAASVDGARPAARPAPETPVVWRLDGGDVLQRLEVQTGLRDEQYAELVKGDLQAGQRVAVGLRKPVQPREAPRIPGMPSRPR